MIKVRIMKEWMMGLVGSAVYRCAREGATFSEMGTKARILSGLL